MPLTKLRDFMDELDNRRIDKEFKGGKGTIYLKSALEFGKVAEFFRGNLVSPGGAAAHLGVSRAMIHQLEKEGKVRAYRFVDTFEDWNRLPFYLKVLLNRKNLTIWIPVEDLDKYAQEVRKKRREKSN